MEHLTKKQFQDYCQRQLTAADLLSVSEHLEQCEACRRQIESDINGDDAFFAMRAEIFSDASEVMPATSHLTLDQMAQYVDGKLSGVGLQMANDHLASCHLCVLAIDDLNAFRSEIAPTIEHQYQPEVIEPSKRGWWRRGVASISERFGLSPTPAFGMAMVVLLLVLMSWVFVRRIRQTTPRQQIAVVPVPSLQPTPIAIFSPSPMPGPSTSQTELVAQLNDGKGQLALDRDGKLSGADELPLAYQNILKKALTTRQVARSPQLEGLIRAPSSLMSSNKEKDAFSVIAPIGEVLMADRPAFRWSAMEGASDYVVEIYDSKFKVVATSPQLTTLSWVISHPLPRGQVYTWQVKAAKEGQEITSPRPPAPQAKFRVLDQQKADELTKAKRAYPSNHLTLGLLYADAGLLKESEQELRLLQKANPDSELVRNLLRQVQVQSLRQRPR